MKYLITCSASFWYLCSLYTCWRPVCFPSSRFRLTARRLLTTTPTASTCRWRRCTLTKTACSRRWATRRARGTHTPSTTTSVRCDRSGQSGSSPGESGQMEHGEETDSVNLLLNGTGQWAAETRLSLTFGQELRLTLAGDRDIFVKKNISVN